LHNVEAGLGSKLADTSQHVLVCGSINPLVPELNPSMQHGLPRFFYWGFQILIRTLRKKAYLI